MRRTVTAVGFVAVLLWAVPTRALEEVGAVAALEGQGDALHTGEATWVALAPGNPVFRGDRLRTQAASKLKVLFQDDSVLTLAPGTELTVDEQVVPEGAGSQSYFSLLVGTVRALVSERYGDPGAQFELETPTAVAGVRGTQFIAAHDVDLDETRVVGLSQTTLVRSKDDPEGKYAVELQAGEETRVSGGKYPLTPTPMPGDVLKSFSTATQLSSALPTVPNAPALRAPQVAGEGPDSAIDQPVEQLREIRSTAGGGRPAPPPPPIPQP
jgi:hypothetical protein